MKAAAEGETYLGARKAPIQHALLDWYARNKRELPWRRTRDPYAILVSEVMLQQTQVERVVPKYQEFLKAFPDFASLAESGVGEVIRAWSGLGYNRRAVRLWRIARVVMSEFDGRLPADPNDLRRLEGVGEYTASAVSCFAFGCQTPVIDTNVRRVLGRLFPKGSALSARRMAALAKEMLPIGRASEWGQGLMDLGASLCLNRRPRCGECPLRAHCYAVTTFGRVPALVAEQRVPYSPADGKAKAPPFKGSSRYYRGRVLARLRSLDADEGITVAELGPWLKADFNGEDSDWIFGLVQGLERDGLITTRFGDGPASMVVSLP